MKASPIVLLVGEESYLVDRELADIETECGITSPDDMNRQVVDAAETDPSGVAASARTLSFMGGKRLIIVKNGGAWKADQWERLIPYFKAPVDSTCLVLIVEKPDKRLTWYKAAQKNARLVMCDHPKEHEMARWTATLSAQAGLKLSPALSASLAGMVEPDLQLLWREIIKLRVYAGDEGKVTEEGLRAIVGESRATTVFVLCDALGSVDRTQALATAKKLLDLGEAPQKLLVMIARHFRMLWKIRGFRGEKPGMMPSAKDIGAHPGFLNKLADQAKKWDRNALHRAFELMIAADLAMKSGGGEEELHNLVLELCEAAKQRAAAPSRN